MLNFNSIDVETANADRASICQIGIVHVHDGEIRDQWKTLIDPEDWFDPWNIGIHGIDEASVSGSPTLPAVREELRRRLRGSVLVSHTTFDRVAFERAMTKYSLEQLQVTWLDSARVARRAWPDNYGVHGWGLKNIAKELGISFRHHDALEDARAVAEIVLRACDAAELDIEGWLQRVERPIFPSSSEAVSSVRREGNMEGPLYGETIVFTGALGIPRREAADLAASSGCNVVPNVTKKVTILVVGTHEKSKLNGYAKSSKHRKAEALIDKGMDIQILSETDFSEIIGIDMPKQKEKIKSTDAAQRLEGSRSTIGPLTSFQQKSYAEVLGDKVHNPLGHVENLQKAFQEVRRQFDSLAKGVRSPLVQMDHITHILRQSSVFSDVVRRFQTQQYSATAQLAESAALMNNEIRMIADAFASESQRYVASADAILAWQASLSNRMAELRASWVLPNRIADSLTGFMRLSHLCDVVHMAEPFSLPVREVVTKELGLGIGTEPDGTPTERDDAAVQAGLNHELIAFPPKVYNEVLVTAGFKFGIASAPVPQTIEPADSSVVFDLNFKMILDQVVQHLRQRVEKCLKDLAGEKWVKQRVPQQIRERWKERQDEAHADGCPIYDLIQYSDFMDVTDIVCQSDNWNEAFKPIFRNKDDFRVSMQRIHPIRKALDHTRPLCRSDILILVAEATRILGALGVARLD